jgi:hypothetical protein
MLRETLDMPLIPIFEQPPRPALATPIHGGDGKTTPAKVCYGLKILLNEFAAPLEEADGAKSPLGCGVPSRKTD